MNENARYDCAMGSPAVVEARTEQSRGQRISSLDGLRAVSIVLVVLSHTKSLLPATLTQSGLFRYLVGGGLHGVQVFFVISGYLITLLLLREIERTADISLKSFYVRRIFRIFPAFYAYLAAIAVLWIAGWTRQDGRTFLAAASYTIVYLPHPQGWLVQHAWSLSIEEQFYLIWPVLLLISHRRGFLLKLAIGLLAAMPALRSLIAFHASAGALEHNRLLVNLSSIDMLMMGCLLALLSGRKNWRAWCERWMRGWPVAALAFSGLVLVPYAGAKLGGSEGGLFAEVLGFSVTALAIGAATEYVVRKPESAAGRVLNTSAMRHIGLISYSIYLWQQLFTASDTKLGLLTFPLILITAEISFRLIERPAMRFRARIALG